jgi:polyisoprenoid-binding protein YceI
MPGRIILSLLLALALLSPAAQAEPRSWVPVPGKSHVAFEATFPLGDFTGRTEALEGEFRADTTNLGKGVTGFLRFSPATLRTGIQGRDRDMREALRVDRHPEIRFTAQQVQSSFPSVAEGADVILTIRGLMLIRGVERPMSFSARARLREDRVWVRGESTLKMTDFGIAPPTRLFLAVKDEVAVRFDLLLARAE